MARLIEYRCPHCGKPFLCDTYSIDEDNFDLETVCPKCGRAVYICCKQKGGESNAYEDPISL